MRQTPTSLLCLLVLALLLSISDRASSQTPGGPEAVRAHLARKGSIVPRPEKQDLLRYGFVSAPSLKNCTNLGMRDTPPAVQENNLSFYRVNFKQDPKIVCADSPSRDACLAISGNCLAYGRAMFCDIAYLERLRLISDAAYFTRFRRLARSHDGITKDSIDDISPFVMQSIATYEKELSSKSLSSVSPDKPLIAIEHLADCTAGQAAAKLVRFGAASVLLGHEIAHLIEFACPAAQQTIDVSAGLKEAFQRVTCQEPLRAEVLADVRALRLVEIPLMMAQGIDDGSFELSEDTTSPACNYEWLNVLGISRAGAAAAKAGLKHRTEELLQLGLLSQVEYELAAYGSPDSALQAYTAAVDLYQKNRPVEELNAYMVNHAKRGVGKTRWASTHGLPSLRGSALLVAVDFPGLWQRTDKRGVANSSLHRLSGLMAGQIAQANVLGCGKSESDAEGMGWFFVQQLMVPAKNLSGATAARPKTFSDEQPVHIAGLIWTGRDNGEGISWFDANSYCSNLELGGFDDWRLPEIGELETLNDPNRNAAESVYTIRRPFKLTRGTIWSATKSGSNSAWYFIFFGGRRYDAPLQETDMRSICVRRP